MKFGPPAVISSFLPKIDKIQNLEKGKNRAIFARISPEIKSMKREPQIGLHAKNIVPKTSQVTWGVFFVFPNPPL